MKNKYRVVSDNFCGYEVQIKRWWFPFWIQCWNNDFCCNTFGSLERAKKFIEDRKNHKKEEKMDSKKIYYEE